MDVILLNNENVVKLVNNLKEKLNTNKISLYCPIIDILYDDDDDDDYTDNYIFKSKYFVKELIENTLEEKSSQNTPYIKREYKAKIINNYSNQTLTKNIFIKVNPILDVISYILDKYKLDSDYLPNNKESITSIYINNFNNQAYIDSFFSFLSSKLTESGKAPCFPLYYGTVSALLNKYKFDITEDYSKIKYHNKFQSNLNNKFILEEIEIDESGSAYSSCNSSSTCNSSDSSLSLDYDDFNIQNETLELSLDTLELDNFKTEKGVNNSNSKLNNNFLGITEIDDTHNFSELMDDNNTFKYCVLDNFPTQLLFMEKLEYTLDDLIEKELITNEEWKSILFQICFGLAVAQKAYSFVHNDLHSQNIMFVETNEEYLYFEYNNKFYKVPTFGKITKIIDFGRATFEYNGNIYFSSVFDEYGDAEGQYDYPEDNNYNKCKIRPNPSFDLSRLSSTIIEHFDYKTEIYALLHGWLIDKNGNSLVTHEDNFNLYIKIAKDVNSAVPKKQLTKNVFKKFLINKKKIDRKNFIFKY